MSVPVSVSKSAPVVRSNVSSLNVIPFVVRLDGKSNCTAGNLPNVMLELEAVLFDEPDGPPYLIVTKWRFTGGLTKSGCHLSATGEGAPGGGLM